jgi:hypothetical protein
VRSSRFRILVLVIGEIRMASGFLVDLNRTMLIDTERLIISTTPANGGGRTLSSGT